MTEHASQPSRPPNGGRLTATLRASALVGVSLLGLLGSMPARADEMADLKAQLQLLTKRLNDLEKREQQRAAKPVKPSPVASAPVATPDVVNLDQRVAKLEAEKPALVQPGDTAARASAGGIFSGKPIHVVETEGTDVILYGLLEPSLIYQNHATNKNSSFGPAVSWFSGNRWGLYVNQAIDPASKLNAIARLESEFELPSGDMDTGNVLFNRDAWAGIESPDLGKLTFGRQNTLPRDFTNIWGDPYGAADVRTDEGGYTNNNNFKQIIFYSGGGSGASGQGDTRLDNGIVYKKLFDNGLALGVAYAFSDGNGPGGPNGSGVVPGAGLGQGSVESIALGYNASAFHVSAFYNHTNVLERAATGDDATTKGLSHQSFGIGGNYLLTDVLRLNLGYLHYTADQGRVGTRNDDVVTVSAKFSPPGKVDFELGWQDFFAKNAALTGGGFTFVPYKDASGATSAGDGTRMTTYGSVIYHPTKTLDVYLAADYLSTTGKYHASQAHGFDSAVEVATGARLKF
jgi:predicted porin